MTEFAAVAETRDAKDASSPEPQVETKEQTDKPVALPGLSIGPARQGALQFTQTKFESFTWNWKDVENAVKEHGRCLRLIGKLRNELASSEVKPSDRSALDGALDKIELELTALAKAPVATDKRQAAIQVVNAAAGRIGEVAKQATEAVTAKAIEDEQLRKAEEEKRKKEEDAKAEAEAKSKKEEEDAKKAAEEQQRQENEAKAAEEAKRKKEEEAKAEAEAKRKKEEEDAKKAAEDKRLAEEAAAKKKADAEQAAKDRLAAYEGKVNAHEAAQEAAEGKASEHYGEDIAAADLSMSTAVEKLTKKQKTLDNKTYAAAAAEHKKAIEKAKEEKAERKGLLEDKLAGVASSESGKKLADDDLKWVMSESTGDFGYAQILADTAVIGGLAAAKTVAQEGDAKTIAPKCRDLFSDGVEPKLVVRMARLLTGCSSNFASWLVTVPATALAGVIGIAEKFDPAMVLLVIPVLGTGFEATDFLDAMNTASAKIGDVKWLMDLKDEKGFRDLVKVVTKFPLKPAKVRPIHTAAAGRFDLDEIAIICNNNHKELDQIVPVLPNANAHSVTFMRLYLQVSTKKPPSELLQQAVRAEALLTDAPRSAAVHIMQYQADRPFGRGPDNPYRTDNINNDARTGFIRLTFPDGSTGTIHTHWNTKNKNPGKISSMHVQNADGSNGIELNEWYVVCPKLVVAVVAAHDRAGTKVSMA
jgi:chemotaxis protein histidine kinase CheA